MSRKQHAYCIRDGRRAFEPNERAEDHDPYAGQDTVVAQSKSYYWRQGWRRAAEEYRARAMEKDFFEQLNDFLAERSDVPSDEVISALELALYAARESEEEEE